MEPSAIVGLPLRQDYRKSQKHGNKCKEHLPPVFAQLADLVHKHTLLDLVQGDGGRAQLREAAPRCCQVQHTLREHQHHVQVAQGVCVFLLQQRQLVLETLRLGRGTCSPLCVNHGTADTFYTYEYQNEQRRQTFLNSRKPVRI